MVLYLCVMNKLPDQHNIYFAVVLGGSAPAASDQPWWLAEMQSDSLTDCA